MEKGGVIEWLRSLHDLSKAINSTLEIDEVVEMVMEKAARLMKAEKVVILLLDREEHALDLHSSRGFRKGELRVRRFRNVLPFDHCIVHKGTVITMKELLGEDDYRRIVGEMPFWADMVFAPIEIKGEAYGLLGVTDGKERFSEIELEIFCALGSQSAVAMENANLYRRLKDTFLHTAEALAEAVNSRDPYTGGHVRRVEGYSLTLAGPLGLSAIEGENLRLAAIMHDIGKIGVDDAILRKGGDLTAEEEAVMRRHPEIGARILGLVDEMKDVIPGVRHHHERFDGGGYPDGLKGKNIPLEARIIAITDAYDALTTERPYRGAVEKEEALHRLREGSWTHFDPFLVEIFCEEMTGKRGGRWTRR